MYLYICHMTPFCLTSQLFNAPCCQLFTSSDPCPPGIPWALRFPGAFLQRALQYKWLLAQWPQPFLKLHVRKTKLLFSSRIRDGDNMMIRVVIFFFLSLNRYQGSNSQLHACKGGACSAELNPQRQEFNFEFDPRWNLV